MFLIISYDITDDKRRLAVANLLLNHGAQRVQYSVFECHITERNLTVLRRKLGRAMDAEADSIRFYPLCENCQPKIELMGVAQPSTPPGLRII